MLMTGTLPSSVETKLKALKSVFRILAFACLISESYACSTLARRGMN
jgi:hypothetical protein